MLKRTLFFGSPGKLSIKNGLLVYESGSPETAIRTFPVEDIGFLVLESMQLSLNSYCLNFLTECNVAVILCDASHMPSAQMIPFCTNSLMQKFVEAQVRASDALKQRLWKQTVQAKISNQAAVLRHLGLPFQRLHALEKEVCNGDEGNMEAVAARYYFQQLGLDQTFIREREGEPPNHALNYGYAILRAAVARALIGSGLLCVLGIHHSNQYDPFVLADDIMEPYRPFVDELVFANRQYFSVPVLEKEHKAKLLQLLIVDVKMNGERRPLMNALSYTTASLVRCFQKVEKSISYPEFYES